MANASANTAAPLLMLPGLICDGQVFAGQVASFPQAIAFPGYGLAASLAAMARVVLDGAPSRLSLLGHSMGARVALEILRIAPERVERLALISTGVHPPVAGELEKRFALLDLGRRQGMAALVDAWLPPMVPPARRDDLELMPRLRQMCIGSGLAMYDAHITALLARPSLDSLLPEIACPTLVAVGDQDCWSPVEQHAAIAGHIPSARLAIVAGAGHMLPAEAPDLLNAHLREWLETPIA